MTFDAEAVLGDILSCFPPDHFDKAKSLLDAYVAKLAEHDRLMTQVEGAMARRDISQETADAHERACDALEEALEMAEALGLLPGDRRKKRPFLQ